ncbi:DDE-type integrase/transposase/recombinase [Priestia endophytica]|uniref:DDE-type integrase/transposase/recombinase n=1 Tax=Priestia endophytica TaxID=135735 RepID=UPI0035580EB6
MVNETHIKYQGKRAKRYLYRAVDSEGHTTGFYPSKSRNKKGQAPFLKKSWPFLYVSKPRIIILVKNPAYPKRRRMPFQNQ